MKTQAHIGMTGNWIILAFCFFIGLPVEGLANGVWQEDQGFVLMEMEKGIGDRGKCWKEETKHNPEGGVALRFSCGSTSSNPPSHPLTYKFKISKTDVYTLYLKIWKDHEATGAEKDKANDVYVRVEGDFESGGSASLEELKKDNKCFGGKSNKYDWTNGRCLDYNHKKWDSKYKFKAGETYTLTIQGRSKDAVVDRILFTTNNGEKKGKASGTAESKSDSSGSVDPDPDPNPDPEPDPVTVKETVLNALKDFSVVPMDGYHPFYKDSKRKALGIDASKVEYRKGFAATKSEFNGGAGVYDITLITMAELDGESSYRVKVDGILVGEFKNPVTDTDYKLTEFKIGNVKLKKGSQIQVEASSHTNGKVPEGNGTAWSRGRWTEIKFTPSAKSTEVKSIHSKSKTKYEMIAIDGALYFKGPIEGVISLRIFDLNGSQVYETNRPAGPMKLKSGIYLILIQGINGVQSARIPIP